MLPFWTNYLIRTYAWIVLLNPAGLVNSLLLQAGAISEPLPLLYNKPAVVLGLVYSYTPFVILAIYSSLQRLDPPMPKLRATWARVRPRPSCASSFRSPRRGVAAAPSSSSCCRSGIS